MINYHPVGDVYHCCYRLLILTKASGRNVLSYDLLRLMDFYFLFPHLLKTISIPSNFRKHKKIFNAIEEPFEVLSSPARIFYTLGSVQDTAIRNLIARGFFDRACFIEKLEVRLVTKIDDKIVTLYENEEKVKQEWFSSFLEVFLNCDFNGERGLKARSGLMEFRYDSI